MNPIPRFLIGRDFALLWTGQGVSLIGDMVFDTTLVLWIATSVAAGVFWAPLAVSGVLLATFIPAMVSGPFAGVFADRWNKRRTMLLMDATRAVLILFLLMVTRLVPLPFLPDGQPPVVWTLTAIYGTVAAATVCAAFANPSSFAFLGSLVASPQRITAFARMQLSSSTAVFIGPALAAVLFTLGVQWALLLNAASFLVSFGMVLSIRHRPKANELSGERASGYLGEMAVGLRFFVRNRFLVTITFGSMVALSGAGMLSTLNVFFVTQNLHAPARLYGVLAAALGAGSVLGALVVAPAIKRIGNIRAFWLALSAIGVILVVYSRTTSATLAVIMFFLLGIPASALNVAVAPLLLETTPPKMVGRIQSVFSPLLGTSRILGAVIAGFFAGTLLHGFHAHALGFTFHAVDTILSAAGLVALVAALFTRLTLGGRRVLAPTLA